MRGAVLAVSRSLARHLAGLLQLQRHDQRSARVPVSLSHQVAPEDGILQVSARRGPNKVLAWVVPQAAQQDVSQRLIEIAGQQALDGVKVSNLGKEGLLRAEDGPRAGAASGGIEGGVVAFLVGSLSLAVAPTEPVHVHDMHPGAEALGHYGEGVIHAGDEQVGGGHVNVKSPRRAQVGGHDLGGVIDANHGGAGQAATLQGGIDHACT